MYIRKIKEYKKMDNIKKQRLLKISKTWQVKNYKLFGITKKEALKVFK